MAPHTPSMFVIILAITNFGLGCAEDPVGAPDVALDSSLDAFVEDGGTSLADTAADGIGEAGSDASDAGSPRDASDPDTDLADTHVADTDLADTAPDAPPVEGTAGCGVPHTAGLQCFEEMFEGAMRRYCVSVPESYDPRIVRSIVVGLHGCGGRPEGAHRNTEPQVSEGSADHLFVYPKSLGSCWSYSTSDTVDIRFVRHAIEQTRALFCAHPTRVFSDGMSSGGMMASRLVCDGIADAAAAISLNFACRTPHPVWLYGGSRDRYFSSHIMPGLDGWLRVNGCSDSTVPLPEGPCVEYQGCSARTIWCSDERGHVWPTNPWTAQIVDLFRSVP